MFGLGNSWRVAFPPLLAGVVTGLLTLATVQVPEELDPTGGSAGWIISFLLVFPFMISSLWGWALLAGRTRRLVLIVAGGLLIIFLMVLPRDIAWQVGGNMAAGLAAGLALGMRWRLDAGLLAVTLCLAPVLIWSAFKVPVRENLDVFRSATLESMEETLWQGLGESELGQVRQREEARLEEAIGVMERIFPSLLVVGVLGQSGLILLLVAWLARLSGGAPGLRSVGSFTGWRLPFYLVWVLVLGMGLLLTRLPYLATSGLNLVLVAGMLISLQGLAVQTFFTSRILPGPVQVIFWLIMGMPLVLMLLVTSLVLGLADQWVDMRRRYLAREIE
ncbi:MAG: YybS family protein [Gemmatimonadales bacterium]|nr:YybS family protein [Gemmatimonadales bacterium]